MPILAREPDSYPEHLFDAPAVDGGLRKWWVLHTRPRQEKCLARQLLGNQVSFYLPQSARRSRIRGRLVTAHVPLFTSYLFLRADEPERLRALSTERVVQCLKVPDQDRFGQDLAQIHRLIASGAPITPEERLGPGMAVEIKSGPLAGLRGTILRTTSGRRFVIQVDFIQRGASVELDDYTLTAAD